LLLSASLDYAGLVALYISVNQNPKSINLQVFSSLRKEKNALNLTSMELGLKNCVMKHNNRVQLTLRELYPQEKTVPMTTHDLLMLALMLTPGILLSVAVMASFAAGG
jgi:hypothetical protein